MVRTKNRDPKDENQDPRPGIHLKGETQDPEIFSYARTEVGLKTQGSYQKPIKEPQNESLVEKPQIQELGFQKDFLSDVKDPIFEFKCLKEICQNSL